MPVKAVFLLPRPLSLLGFPSLLTMCAFLKTQLHSSNALSSDSLSGFTLGLLWWWLARGRISRWSRSLWNMVPIRFWRTKMAGIASTLPAEKVTLPFSSICSPFAQLPGRQRAKLAEHLCTRQVWPKAVQGGRRACVACCPSPKELWQVRVTHRARRAGNRSSSGVFGHTLSLS